MPIFGKIVNDLKKIDDISRKLDDVIEISKDNSKCLRQIAERIDEEHMQQNENYQNICSDVNKAIRNTEAINEQIHSINTNVEAVQKQISESASDENKDNASLLLMKMVLQLFMMAALFISLYCSVIVSSSISQINNKYFDLLVMIYTIFLVIMFLCVLIKTTKNFFSLFSRDIGENAESGHDKDKPKEQSSKIHKFVSRTVNAIMFITLCLFMVEFFWGLGLVGFDVSNPCILNITLSSVGAICGLAIYDATDAVNTQGKTWTYNYIALAVAIISLLITA